MIKIVLNFLLGVYCFLWTPFVMRGNCRYIPTCSTYADEALHKHKPLMACWLILKRLSRCHPWGGKGFDPVPDPDSSQSILKKRNFS